jgi:F-type H+-transporting ATPase subunit b
VINVNVTLLIQVINFIVLLLILNAILYKPILGKLREREGQIASDREKADALDKEVVSQEARHQTELAEARKKAAAQKNELVAEAKAKEAEILADARKEAAGIVEDMKNMISKEAEEARSKLREQMTPLAQSVAEKILGRSVS